jgi:glycosyltransferase involved in cell wall biosynthesis
MAQAASPAVADAAVQALGERDFDALHVMRAYLAPLGAAVSERLGIRAPTLDLDEDDAALATAAGDLRTAEAYGRLLDSFGPLFYRCSAASAAEAQTLAARHGLDVQHISNAVECPPQHPRRAWKGGAATVSMLFVGNLTYRPNVEAARVLVSDILPRVRRLVQRPVGVTLVGPSDGRLAQLCAPEVQLTGFVPDLEAVYGAADVAVMAHSSGAGTRIKLLEAFAHGVPVVASPVAASGLEVSDGEHLLLAGDAGQAAAGVAAIVAGRELAERLVQHAGELVRQRYCTGVVIPAMRDFIARRTRADARVVQSSSSL